MQKEGGVEVGKVPELNNTPIKPQLLLGCHAMRRQRQWLAAELGRNLSWQLYCLLTPTRLVQMFKFDIDT